MKRYTVIASLATSSDPWAYVSDRLGELIADLIDSNSSSDEKSAMFTEGLSTFH